HFKKNAKAGSVSEVDGGDFFLSPTGRKDPRAELVATLEAFESNRPVGSLKQPARCAFRARLRFLSSKLGLQYPDVNCEKWDGFMSRFHRPNSVSLVFSSAYTNNPASMFGHLFLKVNSDKGSQLLDTGVNFAAQVPPDENSLAFFYFGVFGGYNGNWSVQPYYEKLNEYIKAESRDLWEYELNLTPDETLFFLEHLWELETTGRTDYYFFDDNCAYQMGRILEAVRPQWTLSQHTIYAIPGEMVKNFFDDPTVVRKTYFRPALRKKLLQKYSKLDDVQKDQFFQLTEFKLKAQQIQDALVLETGNSFMDYQRQLKKGDLSQEEKVLWNEILVQRASLGEVQLPELPAIPEDTRPDQGHDAYAVVLLGGAELNSDSESHEFYSFKMKSAYHDLYNKDLGFKKYSEILFPWFELRYRPDIKNFHLEELGGMQITSLTPLSRLDFHPSWKFLGAFKSPKDFGCLTCRHLIWEVGIGLTEELGSPDHVLYQFLTLHNEFDSDLPQGWRFLPALEAGWLSTIHDSWKIGMQASYFKDVGSTRLTDEFTKIALQQSYTWAHNWEIRQKVDWIFSGLQEKPRYAEVRLDLSYHFR
ncbi:MAG: Lnb N-terminal periplasmic domain-containing protein, partial [Pseudobdellovibrionaceae bacterium]